MKVGTTGERYGSGTLHQG